MANSRLVLGAMLVSVALASGVALADGPQQVGTASKHAGFAAAATDMKDVQKHMHHVLNCLVGPNGKGFDESFGNPCKDGPGAIRNADAATGNRVGARRHAASRLYIGRGCRQEGRRRRCRDAEIGRSYPFAWCFPGPGQEGFSGLRRCISGEHRLYSRHAPQQRSRVPPRRRLC
jgi:hypothetical protein